MTGRRIFLTMLVLLTASACGSGAKPVAETPSTRTPDRTAVLARLDGLTVRLEFDSTEVKRGQTLTGYFVVANPTPRIISFGGCPLSDFWSGLVPAANRGSPLTGHTMSSCGAGSTSVPIGSSERYFGAHFQTRGLRAGDYLAIVRFVIGGEARVRLRIGE